MDKRKVLIGIVVGLTIVSTITSFILLTLSLLYTSSIEYNCCGVTSQNNYNLSIQWPSPPYYNTTVHFDYADKLQEIGCGYLPDNINGTFGAWYHGTCLGNACNIINPYEPGLLISVGITVTLLLTTCVITFNILKLFQGDEYTRLD